MNNGKSFFWSLFSRPRSQERSSAVNACPHDAPYVILDVETTGLDPLRDRIIQLSAIRYDCNGDPIATFDSYIQPNCPVPPEASRINGITDQMLTDAPTAAEISDKFIGFIGPDDILVGYNTTFDLQFLDAEFGGIFVGRNYVDALPIARCYLDYFSTPNYTLETVARRIGFQPEGRFHDALSDCEAVAAILNRFEVDLSEWCKEFRPSNRARLRQYMERLNTDQEVVDIQDRPLDPSHPMYGKAVVFTGELSMSRSSAALMAESVGAVVKSGVSRKTNYLVVGEQDITLVGDDGMSTKEEKAYELNAAGKASIAIIGESEFVELVNWTSK